MPRLTVSTLGAPGLSLTDIIATVREFPQLEVELRASDGSYAGPSATNDARELAARQLAEAGVRVSSLATYINVAAAVPPDLTLASGMTMLTAAQQFGASFIRVFPGATQADSDGTSAAQGTPPALVEERSVVNERAARVLERLCNFGEDLGVTIALETHDSHPRGEDIASILEQVDAPVAAVWDIMHPWCAGESIDRTAELLAPYLSAGAVQVKDAISTANRSHIPLGTGIVPVDSLAWLLNQRPDLTTTLCLESEKQWLPDSLNFDVAVRDFVTWAARNDLSTNPV